MAAAGAVVLGSAALLAAGGGSSSSSPARTVFDGWRSDLAARVTGVSLTFTSELIGGQPSTCANRSRSGETATYCVTSSGVLAKVETSGGSSGSGTSFQLTSYSSSPPASAFAVPQGATVVTFPAGVSVP
jgi:hypothetical protein